MSAFGLTLCAQLSNIIFLPMSTTTSISIFDVGIASTAASVSCFYHTLACSLVSSSYILCETYIGTNTENPNQMQCVCVCQYFVYASVRSLLH